MSIGVESSSHKSMVKAFALRLRRLFPDAIITLGKKVEPVSLKPDVYIKHPDGRQWVYEMVKGNQSREHIQKNHERYSQHAIRDFWILWEELTPTQTPADINQGVFSAFLDTTRQIEPNALLKTIYTIHSKHKNNPPVPIYAFTLNQLGEKVKDLSAIFKTLSIGLRIFNVVDIDKARASYTGDFISLSELQFDQDGFPYASQNTAEQEMYDKALEQLGMISQQQYVPAELIAQFNKLENNPNLQQSVLLALLQQSHNLLSDVEISELKTYIESGKAKTIQMPLIDSIKSGNNISISDPDGIESLSAILKEIWKALEEQGVPKAFIKLLLPVINTTTLDEVGEVMRWQDKKHQISKQ